MYLVYELRRGNFTGFWWMCRRALEYVCVFVLGKNFNAGRGFCPWLDPPPPLAVQFHLYNRLTLPERACPPMINGHEIKPWLTCDRTLLTVNSYWLDVSVEANNNASRLEEVDREQEGLSAEAPVLRKEWSVGHASHSTESPTCIQHTICAASCRCHDIWSANADSST